MRKVSCLVILFFIVFSLESQEKKKSVYIGKIVEINVPKNTNKKIKMEITQTLFSNYRDTLLVMDDDLVSNLLQGLKSVQMTGCSTEKCEQQLTDAFSADYKITGLLQKRNGKFFLILKLYKLTDGAPNIYSQVKNEFNFNELEKKTMEMTKTLMSPFDNAQITKKENALVNIAKRPKLIWSDYQGQLNWSKANLKCEEIQMRLPTMYELKMAYDSGITDYWRQNGNIYWSSQNSTELKASETYISILSYPYAMFLFYAIDILDRSSYTFFRSNENSVRCVQWE